MLQSEDPQSTVCKARVQKGITQHACHDVSQRWASSTQKVIGQTHQQHAALTDVFNSVAVPTFSMSWHDIVVHCKKRHDCISQFH